MRDGLFSMTQESWSIVKDVRPGMPLFLYDTSERRIHGVFEAVRLPTLALEDHPRSDKGDPIFHFFQTGSPVRGGSNFAASHLDRRRHETPLARKNVEPSRGDRRRETRRSATRRSTGRSTGRSTRRETLCRSPPSPAPTPRSFAHPLSIVGSIVPEDKTEQNKTIHRRDVVVVDLSISPSPPA